MKEKNREAMRQRKKARKKAEAEHIKKHGNVPMNPKPKCEPSRKQEPIPAPTTPTHSVAPARRTLRDTFGWW